MFLILTDDATRFSTINPSTSQKRGCRSHHKLRQDTHHNRKTFRNNEFWAGVQVCAEIIDPLCKCIGVLESDSATLITAYACLVYMRDHIRNTAPLRWWAPSLSLQTHVESRGLPGSMSARGGCPWILSTKDPNIVCFCCRHFQTTSLFNKCVEGKAVFA